MIRALIAALCLAACADSRTDDTPGRDPGRSVALRVLEIAALEAQRKEKRIGGE